MPINYIISAYSKDSDNRTIVSVDKIIKLTLSEPGIIEAHLMGGGKPVVLGEYYSQGTADWVFHSVGAQLCNGRGLNSISDSAIELPNWKDADAEYTELFSKTEEDK